MDTWLLLPTALITKLAKYLTISLFCKFHKRGFQMKQIKNVFWMDDHALINQVQNAAPLYMYLCEALHLQG